MEFLVIDDSPVITRSLQKQLEQCGVEGSKIHTASSGEEGLARFELVNPDVVLLDVRLRGLSGPETASEMARKDPETRLVVTTGVSREDDRVRRMVAAGAFEVIEKPIHSDEILNLLRLIERESSGAGRIR